MMLQKVKFVDFFNLQKEMKMSLISIKKCILSLLLILTLTIIGCERRIEFIPDNREAPPSGDYSGAPNWGQGWW